MTTKVEQELEKLYGIDLAIAVLEYFGESVIHLVGFDVKQVVVGCKSENVAFDLKSTKIVEKCVKVARKKIK